MNDQARGSEPKHGGQPATSSPARPARPDPLGPSALRFLERSPSGPTAPGPEAWAGQLLLDAVGTDAPASDLQGRRVIDVCLRSARLVDAAAALGGEGIGFGLDGLRAARARAHARVDSRRLAEARRSIDEAWGPARPPRELLEQLSCPDCSAELPHLPSRGPDRGTRSFACPHCEQLLQVPFRKRTGRCTHCDGAFVLPPAERPRCPSCTRPVAPEAARRAAHRPPRYRALDGASSSARRVSPADPIELAPSTRPLLESHRRYWRDLHAEPQLDWLSELADRIAQLPPGPERRFFEAELASRAPEHVAVDARLRTRAWVRAEDPWHGPRGIRAQVPQRVEAKGEVRPIPLPPGSRAELVVLDLSPEPALEGLEQAWGRSLGLSAGPPPPWSWRIAEAARRLGEGGRVLLVWPETAPPETERWLEVHRAGLSPVAVSRRSYRLERRDVGVCVMSLASALGRPPQPTPLHLGLERAVQRLHQMGARLHPGTLTAALFIEMAAGREAPELAAVFERAAPMASWALRPSPSSAPSEALDQLPLFSDPKIW